MKRHRRLQYDSNNKALESPEEMGSAMAAKGSSSRPKRFGLLELGDSRFLSWRLDFGGQLSVDGSETVRTGPTLQRPSNPCGHTFGHVIGYQGGVLM